MVPFYHTTLVIDHRVGGFDDSYSPSLDLGLNSNLTVDDIENLRCFGVSVNDENYPAPDNIPDQVP